MGRVSGAQRQPHPGRLCLLVKPLADHCFLLRPAITVFYVFLPQDAQHQEWAARFVSSHYNHPPGIHHHTVIICNGNHPSEQDRQMFGVLPEVSYYYHDDSGWDLGGYIAAAKTSGSDMGFYCGGSMYFWKAGWLARMVEAWEEYGDGLYGSQASYEVTPHINTTGFFCSPELLRSYPYPVITKDDRYNFEHGFANRSQGKPGPDRDYRTFWKMIYRAGRPVKLVTWDGVYDWWEWRKPPNILRRGDQTNLLCWWKHTDQWAAADEQAREHLGRITDTMVETSGLARHSSCDKRKNLPMVGV